MPLTGIVSTSPIPRRARQFNLAAGTGLTQGSLRPVVLVGNMLSSGSETVETLGGPILSLQDCFNRFGRRSEIAWMYRAYVAVDQQPLIYAVAMSEGGGAAAAAVTFTFATTSTVQTVVNIDSVKGRLQVQVNVGDVIDTMSTAVTNAINADPDLPFTASDLTGVVTITTSNKGPRAKAWLNQLRMSFADPTQATTITKGSVTGGTTADSCANAITAVDTSTFTYHCIACTSTSSVTSSDGGVGQYANYINGAVAPTGGKSSELIFAVDGTSAQATAVTQSAVVNSGFMHCYRAKNNDWPPSMVAAHHTAIHRSQEVNYAAANLAGWTQDSTKGQTYLIPDPFTKTDRPTSTEQTTDLQGGVSTVGFRTDGTPYIVRSITTRSWVGSSSTADYRAREGHIPSVVFKFWDDLSGILISQNQPNIADDPPQGAKPVAGFWYPGTIRSIANDLITRMCGPYQNGMALLDPSVLPQMLAATTVKRIPGGFELDVSIAAVVHNLFDDTLISEIGQAY